MYMAYCILVKSRTNGFGILVHSRWHFLELQTKIFTKNHCCQWNLQIIFFLCFPFLYEHICVDIRAYIKWYIFQVVIFFKCTNPLSSVESLDYYFFSFFLCIWAHLWCSTSKEGLCCYFLSYRWKHSEKNRKQTIRICDPFSILKFDCLDQLW